jgi:sulfur carrier protein ThiS
MKIDITIDEKTMRALVARHLADVLGEIRFRPEDVVIEVKSKQNYRAEWETAEFRAKFTRDVT